MRNRLLSIILLCGIASCGQELLDDPTDSLEASVTGSCDIPKFLLNQQTGRYLTAHICVEGKMAGESYNIVISKKQCNSVMMLSNFSSYTCSKKNIRAVCMIPSQTYKRVYYKDSQSLLSKDALRRDCHDLDERGVLVYHQ